VEIYRINRYDGAVAMTTFTVSLLTKPDDGIIVGIVLALALYVWKTMHTRVYFITKDKETGYFIACPELLHPGCEQLLILKPEGPFIYVNAEHMRDEILRLVDSHPPARVVILDMAAVYYMDTSGIDALKDLMEELHKRNVRLLLIHVEDEVLNAIAKEGLIEQVEIHETKKEAISSAFKYLDKNICKECDKDIFSECKERR
jgi:SulP family sulfate permease